MPTPDRPSPELLASLPVLRSKLEDQRQFRIEQLAMLGEPVNGRHPGIPAQRPTGSDRPELDHPEFDHPRPVHAEPGHREIAEALADGARRVLADIETALSRMHTGRYGTCLRCGSPIPVRVLQLIPYLALCEQCQR
jgi:hypothetical protein